MTDLQATVAAAADRAGAHATAPALLLQAQSALGRLAALTNEATAGGRRPFRIPHLWDEHVGELAYLVYLVADQTGVSIEDAARKVLDRVVAESKARRAEAAKHEDDRWG